MQGYLGELECKTLIGTPFENFKADDWAMKYIEMYGGIDGVHHKQWVLDQVARILKGTPVVVVLAAWENGHTEYRFQTESPNKKYQDWVEEMKAFDTESGEYQYDYDEGVAP